MLISLREWRESLREYWGQRANFPCVVCEVKASQVLLEDVSSSRIYLRDIWSSNGPLSCGNVSGKARWCINDVLLPSAWSDRNKWGWKSDYERDRDV